MRLVKPIVLVIILLLSSVTLASAYDIISQVPYSGHLSDKYITTANVANNIVQIYYQKFKTGNNTLSAHKIQLKLPSNITSSSTAHLYMKIGIAKSIESPPYNLKYTPLSWYNLMSGWVGGFRCYKQWSFNTEWDPLTNSAWTNISFSTSLASKNLEPNTEYYIAYFIFYDYGTGYLNVNLPRGTLPGSFGAWSVHRGNVTSTSWTDSYSSYNLSYVLWGYKLGITTGAPASVTNDTVAINSIYMSWPEGRNYTYGYWLGNTTTDVGSFERNRTLMVNSTTTNYPYTVHEYTLMPGKYYHLRSWVSKNATYPFTLGNEIHFLTNPSPPTNLVIPTRSPTGLQNFSWTNGSSYETGLRTVIFNRTSGPVTDPYTALPSEICYNGTGVNYSSVILGSTDMYLTAYSYLEKTEDGENIGRFSLTGASSLSSAGTLIYNVYIMREKPPYGLVNPIPAPSSIEFSTKDGLVTYVANATTNPWTIYANSSDLVTYRYMYSATGPIIERNHIIPDSNLSSDRNIYIYVPTVPIGTSKGNSKPVAIIFRDKTQGLFTVANHAHIYILANGSKSSTGRDIHSDYMQADYGVRTYLVIGDQYALFAKSDVLPMTRLGSLIIFDDTYYVDVTSENVQNISWQSVVSIKTGWTGSVVWAKLTNRNGGLYNVSVRLYNATGALKKTEFHQSIPPKAGWEVPWDFNFTYDTGNLNKTLYYANYQMKYNKSGVDWVASAYIFWNPEATGSVDMDYLDTLITGAIGPSPIYIPASGGSPEQVVPYSTIILSVIIIMFFFIFDAKYAGFLIMFLGGMLGAIKIIGIASETLLPTITVVLIFFIGVLVFLITRHEEMTEGPTYEQRSQKYIRIRRKK